MNEIDLSIVVVSWNTRDLVLACLEQIDAELRRTRAGDPVIETFVVDNGSRDATAEAVRETHPWVKLVALPENTGYARGNNAALRLAQGRVVLLLNSDVSINRAAVLRCLEVLQQTPDAGAVGPQLLHADGRPQNTMHPHPSVWSEMLPSLLLETLWPSRFPSKRRPPREVRAVAAVRGAALFVKGDVLREVGPLSESYFFFLEETDWCLRMQSAGWRVLFVPDVAVVHQLGASSKRVDPLATRIEYHRSLYHFLRVHRGASAVRVVQGIRVLKSLGSLALLGLAAPFSSGARARGAQRYGLLRWHVAGCPVEGGLADWSDSRTSQGTSDDPDPTGDQTGPQTGDQTPMKSFNEESR